MHYWTEDEVRTELLRTRVSIDALRRDERQRVVARTNGPVLSDRRDATGMPVERRFLCRRTYERGPLPR